MAKIKKKVKRITVDAEKCNGCRTCEVMCSGFHSTPQWSSDNPAKSRIQVIRHPLKDIFLPVFAGEYTPAECGGRISYNIDDKVYDECAFCRAACPSRGRFIEPDSGLPLGCDMCRGDPTLEEPMCVYWCLREVLKYEEREVEVEEQVELDAVETGLNAMADKFGWDKILRTAARMTKKD
jgi:benzoyl-CoA reductase subunit BamC